VQVVVTAGDRAVAAQAGIQITLDLRDMGPEDIPSPWKAKPSPQLPQHQRLEYANGHQGLPDPPTFLYISRGTMKTQRG
jgi:hypothetical protein